MFNILLLGDSGCGKTTYLKRLKYNIFDKNFVSTQGVEQVNVNIINFYDSSGEEKFYDFSHLQNNINFAIIFFSLNSKLSYKNINFWEKTAKKLGVKDIIYIANKSDLNLYYNMEFKEHMYTMSIKNDSVEDLFKPVKMLLGCKLFLEECK
jgi:GTPase SAR1 family protein